ncbi:VanZ family protein [Pelagicoccus mobilis]|uniref:VanZ family protein n=1 Tax=Pelagicoccus mobilis TaxID=415221 RepID=A0A934RY19_9BACT|nr:VanZ family protein [Pelagicoccus mobilis]MBK1878666.1 VanZ family protein [Pelagicoccus mobilis]
MSLQPTFRRSVLFVLVLVTLSFGWWPYSFLPENDVSYATQEQALRFNGLHERGDFSSRGVAYSEELLDTRAWEGVTIKLELRGRPRKSGLGVFLEFFEEGDEGLPTLMVSQWQQHLALRSERLAEEVERGYSEIGHKEIFSRGGFVELLIASEGKRTHVYVDGKIVSSRSDFPLLGPDNRFLGRLAIGNSADGTRPFTGEIRRLKIYSQFYRAGSAGLAAAAPVYDFDFRPGTYPQGLSIPDRYELGKRNFFGSIDSANFEKESYKSDVLVNALGFIPVGICFAAATRRRVSSLVAQLVLVGLASFCLSMLIEWGQGYLVHRDSSLQDVLLNTFSGMVALIVPRRWILFL